MIYIKTASIKSLTFMPIARLTAFIAFTTIKQLCRNCSGTLGLVYILTK